MKYTGRCENDFSVHADLGWWRRPPGGRTGTAAFNQVSNTQASERPAIQARNVGAELISLGINRRPWNILKSPKTTTNVVWTRRLTPPWNPKPKLKATTIGHALAVHTCRAAAPRGTPCCSQISCIARAVLTTSGGALSSARRGRLTSVQSWFRFQGGFSPIHTMLVVASGAIGFSMFQGQR